MNGNGVAGRRRRSAGEVERVVEEYERSGLTRQEFSVAHGLKVHTLDMWRRRVGQTRSRGEDRIVPVELVSDAKRERSHPLMEPSNQRPLRVVLQSGLRVEVEPGFDGSELRRLIALLEESRKEMRWEE